MTPSAYALARGLRSGLYFPADDGLERRCSQCREYLPATTEFFHKQGDRLNSKCKPCYSERYGRTARGIYNKG